MGARYSTGIIPAELQRYTEMTIDQLQICHGKFLKCSLGDGSDGMLVTRAHFSRAFGLESEVGFRHFNYWDPSGRGIVSAIDVWGSLAICSSGREELKIKFIFGLMDLDHDGKLNRIETTLLIHGVCRGVARIKQISAPPPDAVQVVVDALFSEELNGTSNRIKCDHIDLKNLSHFLRVDESSRRFLSSLDRTSHADVQGLYEQEEKLLLELATIDARLNEIEAVQERQVDDMATYNAERGGDMKQGFLCAMRRPYDSNSSDEEKELASDKEVAERLKFRRTANAVAQVTLQREDLKCDTDNCLGCGQEVLFPNASVEIASAAVWEKSIGHSASRKGRRQQNLIANDMEHDVELAKLNAQRERRASRARERKVATSATRAELQYSDTFRRCARKHIRGCKDQVPSDVAATADVRALTNFWKKLPSDSNGYVQLDVDLFEDLFEELAVFLSDQEATEALSDIPHNDSHAYTLRDVIEWWRSRNKQQNPHLTKAQVSTSLYFNGLLRIWKGIRQGMLMAKKLLRERILATRESIETFGEFECQSQKTLERSALQLCESENVVFSQKNDPVHEDDRVGESASKPDEPPPAVATMSLNIGQPTSIQSKVHISVHHTISSSNLDASTENVDYLEEQVEKLRASMQGIDVTAAGLLDLEAGREALSRSRQQRNVDERSLVDSPMLNTPIIAASDSTRQDVTASGRKTMRNVVWLEMPARQGAKLDTLQKIANEVESALNAIPRDYSSKYFDLFQCDVVERHLKSSVQKDRTLLGEVKNKVKMEDSGDIGVFLLRLKFFSATDWVEDFESELDAKARLSALFGKADVVVECSKTLSGLLRSSAEYHKMHSRIYGPQMDELDPESIEPCNFRSMRRAALRSILAGVKEVPQLSPEALRMALEELGSSSVGAFASPDESGKPGGQKARLRLKNVLLQKAARYGFGELSKFGKRIVARIFQRYDSSQDDALDYVEFAALCRSLGEPPPFDVAEYVRMVVDSKLLAKHEVATSSTGEDRAEGTRILGITEHGVRAQYERRGRLYQDAAKLGIGSLDDFIEATASLTTELNANVASALEATLSSKSRATRSQHTLQSIAHAFCPPTTVVLRELFFEIAVFALRFVKGMFISRDCRRVSDLFEIGQAPTWLMTPAWIFTKFHALRSKLADGESGFLPSLRKAVADYFGESWANERVQNWYEKPIPDTSLNVHDLYADPLGSSLPVKLEKPMADAPAHEEQHTADTRRDRHQCQRIPADEKEGQMPARSDTLNGNDCDEGEDEVAKMLFGDFFSAATDDKSAAQSGIPLNLNQADHDANAAELMARRPGSQSAACTGLIARMSFLRTELHTLECELASSNLPRRVRALLEERYRVRTRELVARERTLERCAHLAMARSVRAFDAARDMLRGPCSVGMGNKSLTLRCKTEGWLDIVDLERLLPAGLGETSVLKAAEIEKQVAARNQFRRSLEKIDAEKKRIAAEAAHAAEHAKTAALLRARLEVQKEAQLYQRGARAAHSALAAIGRQGGVSDAASEAKQTKAEEYWSKLANFRLHKRTQHSASYAISVNNIAVLFYDRGCATSSIFQLQESLKRIGLARQALTTALRDTLVADSAAMAAQYAEHSRACLEWDRHTASAVAQRAQEDFNRVIKENQLVRQIEEQHKQIEDRLSAIEDSEIEDLKQQQDLQRAALMRSLARVRRERYATASTYTKSEPPPSAPTRDLDRHDDLYLIYAIVLSNELHILEKVSESDDLVEHRQCTYRICVAMYACLGIRSRRQLERLNTRYIKLHPGKPAREVVCDESDADGDSSDGGCEGGKSVENLAAGSMTPIIDSPKGNLRIDLRSIGPCDSELGHSELQALQVEIELAGTFPPPNPQDTQNAKLAKLQAERFAEEKARLAQEAAERDTSDEDMKLKRLRRYLSSVTRFDQETFKLLQLVQPKRAARIRARELRQNAERQRRMRRTQQRTKHC